MQKLMKDYLKEWKRRQKRRRRIGIAVVLLIVIVAGTVTGGLTRSGVAMTEDAKCGLQEHQHEEACYQDVLICGQGEEQQENPSADETESYGHQHTDECYVQETVLDCGLEENEGHEHTEDCYESEDVLICAEEESEGHEHTSDCYETEEVLTCTEEEGEDHEHTSDCYEAEDTIVCSLEESEGHEHTSDCYEREDTIICSLEEGEGHEHTEDCYKTKTVLQCDLEESEATQDAEEDIEANTEENDGDHIHTEECYERQPICGLEEHTHIEECWIDRTADVEDASDWEAMYASVEWTDSWGADLVTAAQMQLGYKESIDNYELAEDGSHKGYTRYGDFSGDEYMDWDAAFVNFCMYYAGLAEAEVFPTEADTNAWYEAFAEADEKNPEYLSAPEDYEPQAGDIIFFERGSEEEPDLQMGIVSSYDAEKNEIMVIEGDSDDEVKENTYDINNMEENQISEYLMTTKLEDYIKNHTRTLKVEGDDYTVIVRFSDEAGIPDEAVLDVREVEEGTDEYQECYDQTLEAMDAEELGFARYFDITFLADGEEIEPMAPVKVTIVYADPIEVEEDSTVGVIHFADDGTVEVLDVETNVTDDVTLVEEEIAELSLEENAGMDSAEESEGCFFRFEQDSFSIFGTVSTQKIGNGAPKPYAGYYTGYKTKIMSFDQLDGKTFFITNIATGSSAMRGEVQGTSSTNAFCLKGEAFERDQTKSEPDSHVLSGDSNNIWRFEKVQDSDQCYICNVGTGLYLNIDENLKDTSGKKISGDFDEGKRIKVTLTSKKQPLNVAFNGDGTIAIFREVDGYKYYINHRSGGAATKDGKPTSTPSSKDSRGFTAWAQSSQQDIANKITLFTAAQKYVVLNPYNIRENGYNSTYRFNVDGEDGGLGGEMQKVAVAIGADEKAFTITLPDDETRKRKEGFLIKDEVHHIEDSENPDAYRWKLKGWYNIANKKYYSVADGPCENVPIDPSLNNVFYADWVAADYKNGNSESIDGKNGGQKMTVRGSDASFITTKMFDYNELVNVTLANRGFGGATLTQNNPLSESWTADVSQIEAADSGKTGFIVMDGAYNNTDSRLTLTKTEEGEKYTYTYIGIRGSLGYPVNGATARSKISDTVSKAENFEVFKTMFDESASSNGTYGVHYMGEADGLYALGSDGYYSYASQSSAASYQQGNKEEDGKFIVYNDPQWITRETTSVWYDNPSFLPFNGEGTGYTHQDGQINYWFGMKTEIDYWLTEESDNKAVRKTETLDHENDPCWWEDKNSLDRRFLFSGDDDVWVFDEYFNTATEKWERSLLLNLSGVHGELAGAINFTTGHIYFETETVSNNKETQHPHNTRKVFHAGQHKLVVYYMERGGGLSNCKITFNLLPSWEIEGDTVQAVSVTKEWKDENNELYEKAPIDSVDVQLYEKNADGTKNNIGEPVQLNNDNEWTYTWKYLDKNKEYGVDEVDVPDSYEAVVTGPENSEVTYQYWRETSKLQKGSQIVIGNGSYGGNGRILQVDSNGAISTASVDVSEIEKVTAGDASETEKIKTGDVLMINNADGIQDNQKWEMEVLTEGAHMQFRLKSVSESENKAMNCYLNIDDVGQPILSKKESASVFYFSANGNLTGTKNTRLVLDDSKTGFTVVSKETMDEVAEDGSSKQRVHIYKYDTTTQSESTSYTITNTLIDDKTKIQIQKVSRPSKESTSSMEPLPGAEFKLYGSDYLNDSEAKPIDGGDSLVSKEDGMIETRELSAGTYYLVETKAPEGYALLPKPIIITISNTTADSELTEKVSVNFQIDGWDAKDHVAVSDSDPNTLIIQVPNIILYTLPSTGGEGIYWYTISGTLLMIAGMLVLYKKKLAGRC